MKALVVDDNELYREVISLALTELGYFVTPAASGREALRILEINKSFHIIITDHEMPGMDGIELIQNILLKKYNFEKLVHLSGSIDYDTIVHNFKTVNPKIRFVNKSTPIGEIKNLLAETK